MHSAALQRLVSAGIRPFSSDSSDDGKHECSTAIARHAPTKLPDPTTATAQVNGMAFAGERRTLTRGLPDNETVIMLLSEPGRVSWLAEPCNLLLASFGAALLRMGGAISQANIETNPLLTVTARDGVYFALQVDLCCSCIQHYLRKC